MFEDERGEGGGDASSAGKKGAIEVSTTSPVEWAAQVQKKCVSFASQTRSLMTNVRFYACRVSVFQIHVRTTRQDEIDPHASSTIVISTDDEGTLAPSSHLLVSGTSIHLP